MVERYVVELGEVGRDDVALVGGKAAHLGELMRIDAVHVPAGFCVTTDAFRRALAERGDATSVSMPRDVADAIADALTRHGVDRAYAVRSSATAEDLATASFAGQFESYLDVSGIDDVIEHVRRCWSSYTAPHAARYRAGHDIDDSAVAMAVVVQHLVPADAAGVLFTADPLTGDRRIVRVEAVTGLGDALVAGRVAADRYEVRDREVTTSAIGAAPVLTEAQLLRLAAIGRRVEAHLGAPQDIEWCLAADEISIVQSRPITTLFPLPLRDDDRARVYVSVAHQQMMTDAMSPLGLSLWQLVAARPMLAAGGRLFVDATDLLAAPASRAGFLQLIERSDPLTLDALRTVIEHGDVVPTAPPDEAAPPVTTAALIGAAPEPIAADESIVTGLVADAEAAIEAAAERLAGVRGSDAVGAVRADIDDLKRVLFDPRSMQVVMAGMEATWWLNDRLDAWLGLQGAADTLSQSVPHNVTSEMGLALLDVADAVRPHPDVVAHLRTLTTDDALDGLAELAGGREALAAIDAFLATYGLRCVGEIDIARPRWRERPAALVPLLLSHVDHAAPGEAARRFERGRRDAEAMAADVLARLQAGPDGAERAAEAARMIDRLRTFVGYREFPKYGIVCRLALYKRALVAEIERLVAAGALAAADDAWFLTFDELYDAVRTGRVDHALVRARRAEHRWHRSLTPPRVLTSHGETLKGGYHRADVPAGALVGLAVSAGTVEGRARVVLDLADADLEPGDILVTAYTDPCWSPVFVAAAGLVTEVGGLMTHGAVIAREYGLPAVVGVDGATRRITDGRRIRVHGGAGYVELL